VIASHNVRIAAINSKMTKSTTAMATSHTDRKITALRLLSQHAMEAEISTFTISITCACEHGTTFEDFTALSTFAA
jgi:hypothetical protein